MSKMSLVEIEERFAELSQRLWQEVDIDCEELMVLQQWLLTYGKELNSERAQRLKFNLDQIEDFVTQQKRHLQQIFSGVSANKKAIRTYKQDPSFSQSFAKLVVKKA